jgi:energy-coupling factor transporter ATP-binding protein EcfA2
MHREFFSGPNFSGRSEALLALLRSGRLGEQTFFIGPYAEAALSGLSSSVTDEIALYCARPPRERPVFHQLDIAACAARKPQYLSGGEQVLLALHCFSRSALDAVAVDTALEQLDEVNRAAALGYLASGAFNVALIDNRAAPAGFTETPRELPMPSYAIDWPALGTLIVPQRATRIEIRRLNFAYGKSKTIFRDASATISPGQAYRLYGANGAGKTTLLKILAGALAPTNSEVMLGGTRYAPWRDGKAALAMATQNPDQQWCGATLAEDMTRRRKALGERGAMLNDARLTALANALGIASLDQHLYELPLAARKRVSWLWPLAGAHPWIVLDEPTLGQDRDTRENFARLLGKLCGAGYGILFVTHDDEFATMLPHRLLQIEDCAISSP